MLLYKRKFLFNINIFSNDNENCKTNKSILLLSSQIRELILFYFHFPVIKYVNGMSTKVPTIMPN
jgi:hypothetical protein